MSVAMSQTVMALVDGNGKRGLHLGLIVNSLGFTDRRT
jgi:hypothetical protein